MLTVISSIAAAIADVASAWCCDAVATSLAAVLMRSASEISLFEPEWISVTMLRRGDEHFAEQGQHAALRRSPDIHRQIAGGGTRHQVDRLLGSPPTWRRTLPDTDKPTPRSPRATPAR